MAASRTFREKLDRLDAEVERTLLQIRGVITLVG
jgi:hypothetical protein